MDVELPQELNDLAGLISAPESLNKPDYTIKGHVDAEGKPTMAYLSKKKNTPEDLKIEILQLRNPIRKPVAGPFEFEFRAWDRDNDSLRKTATEIGSTVRNIKSDLDDLAGISIYRDNFRVLPYGEKKNDWLRLDMRRVNNPTMRLSNNQVVGYVSISLDKNPELKDQSNREGIVESQSFTDFQELIILILNELEQRRYEERPREDSQAESQTGIFNRFNIEPIAALIKNKLPGDQEAKQLVEKTEATIKEGIVKLQEVISRYRRLSTLGLLIDVVLHDGNNFLGRIDSELELLNMSLETNALDLESIKEHVTKIQEEKGILAQLFKRLEPFGGRKRGRPRDIILEETIANIFGLYESELERLHIDVSLPESEMRYALMKANSKSYLQILFKIQCTGLKRQKMKEKLK